jgi:hypothetical protein
MRQPTRMWANVWSLVKVLQAYRYWLPISLDSLQTWIGWVVVPLVLAFLQHRQVGPPFNFFYSQWYNFHQKCQSVKWDLHLGPPFFNFYGDGTTLQHPGILDSRWPKSILFFSSFHKLSLLSILFLLFCFYSIFTIFAMSNDDATSTSTQHPSKKSKMTSWSYLDPNCRFDHRSKPKCLAPFISLCTSEESSVSQSGCCSFGASEEERSATACSSLNRPNGGISCHHQVLILWRWQRFGSWWVMWNDSPPPPLHSQSNLYCPCNKQQGLFVAFLVWETCQSQQG